MRRPLMASCRDFVQRHSRHRFVVRPDVGVRAVLLFALLMASVVWIVVPDDRASLRCTCRFAPWDRQDDVTIKARVVLVPPKVGGEVPWPDWLRQSCADARVELPDPAKFGSRQRTAGTSVNPGSTFSVVGLARLTSRAVQTHQGPLMNPDREGRLLLDTFHSPMDSALVKVIDSVKLMTPIAIKNRHVHRRNNRHGCKQQISNSNGNSHNNNSINNTYRDDGRQSTTPISAALNDQLFLPAFPESFSIAGILLEDGTFLKDRLHEWRIDDSKMGDLLAQLLPEPFGTLIAAGYYFSTIVLGRSIQLPHLFPVDVPSAQWITESKALHMQALSRALTCARTSKEKQTKEHTIKIKTTGKHIANI